jgi:type I restriction enzyme S subunit
MPKSGLDELDSSKVTVPQSQCLEDGDTVIIRSNGNPALVGRSLFVSAVRGAVTFSGFCIRFRPNRDVIDPRFAAYLIRSPAFRQRFTAWGSGTGIQNLSQGVLAAVPVVLPQLDEQRAIAGVLGALDDKIEQNRRTSAALERLARAMFRAWFVDFEPVKAKAAGASSFPSMPQNVFDALPTRFVDSELGPVPEGWECGKLGDLCEINKCTVKAGEIKGEIEYIDIASVTVGRCIDVQRIDFKDAPSRARRRVRHGDTIWSCVRPNRRSYMFVHTPPDNRIVSTGFAVLSPKRLGASYVHELTTRQDFVDYLVSNADGSAYPAVRADHFAAARVLIPQENVSDAFEALAMPLRDLVAAAEQESMKLALLRDYLLPKLLSGEVRVGATAKHERRAG